MSVRKRREDNEDTGWEYMAMEEGGGNSVIYYNILLGVVFAFILMWILIIVLASEKVTCPHRQTERQPRIIKEEITGGRIPEKMPEKPYDKPARN